MYYYALINSNTNVIDEVCINTEDVRNILLAAEDKMIVRPIMLESDYTVQSKEYKGTENGMPYQLYLDIDGSTAYGQVILVKNWSFWSHLKHRSPAVEINDIPVRTHKSVMMCVEEKADTLQLSIADFSSGKCIRYPAMTKQQIVRCWMLDSFSQNNPKIGLLFDCAVLRLIPDYISSAELNKLRNEFITSLKQR